MNLKLSARSCFDVPRNGFRVRILLIIVVFVERAAVGVDLDLQALAPRENCHVAKFTVSHRLVLFLRYQFGKTPLGDEVRRRKAKKWKGKEAESWGSTEVGKERDVHQTEEQHE